jgi:hypothetical protein
MKINWKEVAASSGYQSMKAAVHKNANGRFSKDDRYQKAFDFAINRAKQNIYVHCWLDDNDYTDDLIFKLNEWERKRKQSFLSFYSNHNLPKKTSGILKPRGIRSRIKYYKMDSWYKNSHAAADELSQHLQKKRTKKARWTPEYKARRHRFR